MASKKDINDSPALTILPSWVMAMGTLKSNTVTNWKEVVQCLITDINKV